MTHPVRAALARRSVLVRMAIGLLALAVLVLADTGAARAVRAGVRLLDPARTAPVTGAAEVSQWDAVRRQLAARLTPGTRVVEGEVPDGTWRQRLVEFAVLQGLVVVKDPAQAQYRISVVAPARQPAYGSVLLVVTPAGGR